MDSRESNRHDRRRELDREIERYRKAAMSTLEQLDWIVGCLHRIRKPRIARAIERNRRQIRGAIR